MSDVANPGRSKQMNIRLSDDEAEVVASVAAETGLSASDVMRQALRKAYAERFKPKPKPMRPKK